MSERPWVRVAAKTAAEACPPKLLDDEAKELLLPNLSPWEFVQALVAGEHYSEAIQFLTHALPKREAVWWACRSVRQALPPEPPPEVAAALRAAERWVLDPSDENRRAALAAAEAEGFETAAGLTAAAAGWSGGNLSPPGLPPVAPDASLTPRAAAGAVALAASDLDHEDITRALQSLIEQGANVAQGIDRWEESPPQRPSPGGDRAKDLGR